MRRFPCGPRTSARIRRLGSRVVDPSIAEDVLIVRPGFEVRTVLLAPGGFDFLSAIFAGNTLAEAAQAGSSADARIDLASILGLMLREGAACGILR